MKVPSPPCQDASIGSIIGTLRKQRGLTQKDFAAALGVGRSSVAKWETGLGGETPYLARIAEVLGASAEVFLTGMIVHDATERVSLDEAEMLALYRGCDVSGRLVAQRLVRALLERPGGTTRPLGDAGLPRMRKTRPTPGCSPDPAAGVNPAHAIGSIIGTLRRQKGMTQQAFAEALGVVRSAVAQWETGRAWGAATMHLARIAELLDTTAEVFLTGMASHETEQRLSRDEAGMLLLYRRCNVIDRLGSQHIIRSLSAKRHGGG